MKKKEFIIYSLSHPETGKVRYVGRTVCGIERRLNQHIREAERGKKKSHKANWIMLLLDKGISPAINILEIVKEEEYDKKEMHWIKYFGRENLTNLTDGGEGTFGYRFNEEQRAAISERVSGKNHFWYGKSLPEETKKKIGNANRGIKNGMFGKAGTMLGKTGENHPCWGKECSTETKKKIGDSQRGELSHMWGKTASKETLKRMSISMMGKNAGEKCASSKLNDEKVLKIRDLNNKNPNKYPPQKLSEMFGVHRRTISDVLRRETWKHI